MRAVRTVAVAACAVALCCVGTTASAEAAPAMTTGLGHAVGHQVVHGRSVHNDVSAPLSSIPPAKRLKRQREHPDSPMPTPSGPVVPDPVVQQTTTSSTGPASSNAFAGVGADGLAPSDSDGAVGPNDYFDLVNSRFEIFSKTGASVLGPEPTNTIWSGFGGECQSEDDGDGTVVYDPLADRWIIGQFALGPSGQGPFFQCVAVSATADPTGSYYRYAFQFSSFPDYPKLAVWPDAYYETMNTFSSSGVFQGANSCAYDRAEMLVGLPAHVQCFNATTAYGAILPANLEGPTPPPSGAPDMQIGLGQDNTHLASFSFHVDWSGSGSTFTESDVPVAAYSAACSGGVCIPQLGTTQTLDSLADRMMYAYQYRNFGDHESWVVDYSVDVGGSSGVRWFELRRTPPATSGPLSVYQDSTYAPDANARWMGSTSIDRSGDIGLGYSESSSSMYPEIAYTGHAVADPIDTMEPETVLQSGGGSQTGGLNRWGDYSSMNVDPSDGCTFWYTDQYLPTTGSFNWATTIGTFAFPSCVPRTDSDFSVALLPTTGSVAGSGTATTSVSTGWTAGSTQTISLAASGLPSGVTASFAPATETVGPGQSGTSQLTLSVAAGTAAGTYPVTVTATGPQTSHTATFTLTVGAAPPPPDFSLSAAPSSQGVTAGGAVSYTATVGAMNGFSGSVALGVTGLPSGASASFTPPSVTGSGQSSMTVTTSTSTPAGTYALTVTGTSGTLVHTTAVSLVVAAPPDFSLSVSPASATVGAGQSAPYTVSVGALNGFNGLVTLGVSGLPPGASASFTLGTIAGSGSSTMTVATSPSTPAGSYPLTVTGTSGSTVHSQVVTLAVTAPPDFALSVTPASQSARRGTPAKYTVTVTPLNGFASTVALTASGSPSGISISLSPSSLASGTAVLTASGSKVGTFTITVTGKGGGVVHTASVRFTVTR